MRIIELDAGKWATPLDFCNGLLAALGAPEWHGHSVDALMDSMIWGGINAVEPPYTIRIRNTNHLPRAVIDTIELVKSVLAEQRAYFNRQEGYDVEVELEIAPD
jgi:Barstar (barnase inhibitor)